MTDDELQDDETQEPEPAPADMAAWPGASVKQAAYLNALVFYAGHKANAAKAAKVSRSVTYYWLETDPNFALLAEKAARQAFGVLEDEMIRRAKDGVKKGIYFQGDRVATEMVYSDGLMMMLARAGDPKYRSSTVEHKGEVTLKFKGPLEQLLATYRELTQPEETAA